MRDDGISRYKNLTFCIELATGPVYLTAKSTDSECRSNQNQIKKFFQSGDIWYLTAFQSANSFAKNVDMHDRLKKKILDSPSSVKFIMTPGFAFNGKDHFERGYFVVSQDKTGESVKDEIDGKGMIMNYSKLSSSDGILVKIRSFSRGDSDSEEMEFVQAQIPVVHPAFQSRETNSVYHNIQRCYRVLDEFGPREGMDGLKKICDKYIKKKDEFPSKEKLPTVVVIEGIDGAGKTTLKKNILKKHPEKFYPLSPPECLLDLRSKFDSYPQLIRRLYYSLGNYVLAAMIQNEPIDGKIAILDRSWNSTAAYAIATDVGVGGVECIPPVGHWVYSWPDDLLKPETVLYLEITEEERKNRMLKRGEKKTEEEKQLEGESPLRLRLKAAYNRMENPKMKKIDASGTETDVLDEVLKNLSRHLNISQI